MLCLVHHPSSGCLTPTQGPAAPPPKPQAHVDHFASLLLSFLTHPHIHTAHALRYQQHAAAVCFTQYMQFSFPSLSAFPTLFVHHAMTLIFTKTSFITHPAAASTARTPDPQLRPPTPHHTHPLILAFTLLAPDPQLRAATDATLLLWVVSSSDAGYRKEELLSSHGALTAIAALLGSVLRRCDAKGRLRVHDDVDSDSDGDGDGNGNSHGNGGGGGGDGSNGNNGGGDVGANGADGTTVASEQADEPGGGERRDAPAAAPAAGGGALVPATGSAAATAPRPGQLYLRDEVTSLVCNCLGLAGSLLSLLSEGWERRDAAARCAARDARALAVLARDCVARGLGPGNGGIGVGPEGGWGLEASQRALVLLGNLCLHERTAALAAASAAAPALGAAVADAALALLPPPRLPQGLAGGVAAARRVQRPSARLAGSAPGALLTAAASLVANATRVAPRLLSSNAAADAAAAEAAAGPAPAGGAPAPDGAACGGVWALDASRALDT
eukprot:361689-Chlamydomonas_euryale.AAC.1